MNKQVRVLVSLSVILFKEDAATVAFCPALNLYGYGNGESDAKRSFETALEEFFRYALNKKTLYAELEALGWKIRKKERFTPPVFRALLNKNRDLKNIFDTHPFKKFDKDVAIPLAA